MINERLNRINEIIKEFHLKSECQQGYITLELHNGISECSWGTITYRHAMSGAPNGYLEFRNFKELEEKLEKLIKQ